MAIRLEQISAQAPRPGRPMMARWVVFLALLALMGILSAFVIGGPALLHQPERFWAAAIGVPVAAWGVLGFFRVLVYLGQRRVADGWDQAREQDIQRCIAAGRRSLQVLAATSHTAFRCQGAGEEAQLDALLAGRLAIETQAERLDHRRTRHSRLPCDTQDLPEAALLKLLSQVFSTFAASLKSLPEDVPLALLLDIDTALPEHRLRRLYRQAWQVAGIRQTAKLIAGSGPPVLDHWLDQRIADPAVLMVVAVRFGLAEPDEQAEVAAGLLLGNRLTQHWLPPLAFVHRPEQVRGQAPGDVLAAARQALEWVPLACDMPRDTWRVGIAPDLAQSIPSVAGDVRLCDLDAALGLAGCASFWLATALATQCIQRGAGPQFLFSGDGEEPTSLWAGVVTPVAVAPNSGVHP